MYYGPQWAKDVFYLEDLPSQVAATVSEINLKHSNRYNGKTYMYKK